MHLGVDLARPPAPCLGVGGPEPLMIDLYLTDVARAAVSCAGASPGGAARPEPALAAVCTTATPCPDHYTPETSLMPAHDVFHTPPRPPRRPCPCLLPFLILCVCHASCVPSCRTFLTPLARRAEISFCLCGVDRGSSTDCHRKENLGFTSIVPPSFFFFC